jgi:hypothetical protein
MNKLKNEIKDMLATPQGWLSWFLANIITSLPWFIPLALGWVLNRPNLYTVSAGIWTFVMLPITPFWILNIIIAIFLRKKVFK